MNRAKEQRKVVTYTLKNGSLVPKVETPEGEGAVEVDPPASAAPEPEPFEEVQELFEPEIESKSDEDVVPKKRGRPQKQKSETSDFEIKE